MAKTGYKYTKQQPAKGGRNMLPRSGASSKLNRRPPKKGDANMRSADTIARLKMYTNGKAIRNKEGKVVGGQFMMADRAGDTKITSATGRIAPDRRWFGNTRVVSSTDLDRFREEMSSKVADPYSVVLKRRKLPIGLLRDAAQQQRDGKGLGSGLLATETFADTFGKGSRRKRVKLDQLLVPRSSQYDDDNVGNTDLVGKEANHGESGRGDDDATDAGSNKTAPTTTTPTSNGTKKPSDDINYVPRPGGSASTVPRGPESDADGYAALLAAAQRSNETYSKVNSRTGIVPWGRDSNLEKTEGEGVDWRHAKKDDLFLKGQSKRIWGEFWKVVDCSDVILHVLDCRNVPGTRCTMIERHVRDRAKHKHLIFVLNKIDLVPNWVAKRWMGELAAVRPTIAFHASLTHAFGKGALISLLRQFGQLHKDKKQISVGVIGYPNVGKSSVINTLVGKKSCNVAPIPGETKIWQYITLFRRIFLIDCPGVVVDAAGDTETDSVLKGVVRAERLERPQDFVPAILDKVKREHVAAQYGLPRDGSGTWTDADSLLELVAKKAGRLLKGGEPCLRSAAVTIVNDFQRGKLPHYVAPPELKDDGVGGVRGRGADISRNKQVEKGKDEGDGKSKEEYDGEKDKGIEQVVQDLNEMANRERKKKGERGSGVKATSSSSSSTFDDGDEANRKTSDDDDKEAEKCEQENRVGQKDNDKEEKDDDDDDCSDENSDDEDDEDEKEEETSADPVVGKGQWD